MNKVTQAVVRKPEVKFIYQQTTINTYKIIYAQIIIRIKLYTISLFVIYRNTYLIYTNITKFHTILNVWNSIRSFEPIISIIFMMISPDIW